MALKSIQYRTQGTCSALINVVADDDVIYDVEFIGGCSGNLSGIRELVKGMKIDDVINKLKGIKCGSKQTSCPDQLAMCLLELKNKTAQETLK